MQILNQLPHANFLEGVLKSALAKTSILTLIPLLPDHLHPTALTSYAPSITHCRSLRLPHNDHQAESSVAAVVAAASLTSLICLELYHTKASDEVKWAPVMASVLCQLTYYSPTRASVLKAAIDVLGTPTQIHVSSFKLMNSL